MTLGTLTWTCLLLTAAAPPDVWPLNDKQFQIPIHFDSQRRAEIKELHLYVSHDQGQSWNLEGRVTPDKEFFPYVAREDGPYWFTVVAVDLKGQQTPPDVHSAPVGQRIIVDTVRPDVKMSAERQGNAVKVEWAITEEHPKPETLKLEYAESANGPWTNVPVNPGPTGHAEIQTAAAVTVRMQMQDMAGNQGMSIKQVPGANGASGAVTTGFPPPPPPLLDSPGPGPLPPPAAPPIDPPPGPSPAPPSPQPPVAGPSNWTTLPPVPPAPAAPPGTDSPPPTPTPPLAVGSPPAAASRGTGNQVVAYSQPPVTGPLPPPSGSAFGQDAPVPRGGPAPVQIVNRRMVKLEFDVGKFGPSGLGGVEVYVTTNDGATWEQSAVDPNAMLPTAGDGHNGGALHASVTVQLNQEGVTYGYYVVVKSKAGLGKPPPRPGEQPQIRVELDSTPPDAKLYQVKADPSQTDTLILQWEATDKHLANNPITLEWSAQPGPDGPWNFIGAAELPNSGRYAWRPGPSVPPNVYLRLTVRDTAGNKAVAQTPDPVLIDLSVPEVSNIGLGGAGLSVSPPDPH